MEIVDALFEAELGDTGGRRETGPARGKRGVRLGRNVKKWPEGKPEFTVCFL